MGEFRSDNVNGIQGVNRPVYLDKYNHYNYDFYDLEYEECDNLSEHKVISFNVILNYLHSNAINFIIIFLVVVIYCNLTGMLDLFKDLLQSYNSLNVNITILKMLLNSIVVLRVVEIISNFIKTILRYNVNQGGNYD